MTGKLRISDRIILFPLWLVTLLPLGVLYVFSDFLYTIIYYFIGYRKKVVFENLRMAFPERGAKEIEKIAKGFYHYLCDYFIESIYMINLRRKEWDRRYIYTNPDFLEKYYKEGKSIILAIGHYGNWEWACNINSSSPYILHGIYKPLSNKLFDRLFFYMRSKYGTVPIPMKKIFREIKTRLSDKEPFALIIVGDQRPPTGDLEYWTTFLRQETPVITGMGKLAKKFNFPVIFMNVQRPKRGYYRVTFEEISNDPLLTGPYEIIEKYMRKMEQLICRQPEYWLWSHKRFKYKPEEYKPHAEK